MGDKVLIPLKRNRKVQRAQDKDHYKQRNRIERYFSKLRCFRRFASRDEESKKLLQMPRGARLRLDAAEALWR